MQLSINEDCIKVDGDEHIFKKCEKIYTKNVLLYVYIELF